MNDLYLIIILNEAYFVFNNQIYQLLKGVPKRSPIAGVIAKWKIPNYTNHYF